MRPRLVAQIMGFILFVHFPVLAWSQDHRDSMTNIVYRNVAGNLTSDSKYFTTRLAKKAKKEGSVSLWVTLNYPFETNMSEMTADEIAAQEVAVEKGFSEFLDPLIRQGIVSHPGGKPYIAGNGCRVDATAAGVRALAGDSRMLHMTEVENDRL